MNDLWLFPILLGGFAIIWMASCWLIAKWTGWSELATRYRLHDRFEGRRWYLQHGWMRRFARYKGCLTVGANWRGLYLAVFPLFRVGHPPLFIPWEEIEILTEHDVFRFRHFPGRYLSVSHRLATQVTSQRHAEAATRG